MGPETTWWFGRDDGRVRPRQILEQHRDSWLRIPMFHTEVPFFESFKLRGAGALRALRQQGFPDAISKRF